ncbi:MULTISPECIES: SRPBCC family protein [unclassified Curtobacterium]|uniref:SRPBCC family protein n=1 Tax=unclassified Curtobacterium TaxID=257496 RepID=UPI00226B6FA2|nr:MULTISPECIES: SRPBCC domain-containing protein [unclassified Curtobacterium]
MTEYTITHDYPYPIEDVWKVLTDPAYVRQWTTTGQGGRPEGFEPTVGTEFTFIGKPTIGWAGVVYCKVIAIDAPRSMVYTWKGDEDTDSVTTVTYALEQTPTGTRFTWHHTGFTGLGGFAMAKLLGNVRRKMLAEGVTGVLAASRPEQA